MLKGRDIPSYGGRMPSSTSFHESLHNDVTFAPSVQREINSVPSIKTIDDASISSSDTSNDDTDGMDEFDDPSQV